MLEVGEAGRMAEMAFEEAQELPHVARVGLERLVRRRPLVAQVGEPGRHRPLEVGAEGKIRAVGADFGHGPSS